MGLEHCEKFEGGWCFIVETYAMKSFCKVCRKKPLGPSVGAMVRNFADDVGYWTMQGMPVVSEEVYNRRIECCKRCSDGMRCPYCGCFMRRKAALATVMGCPSPERYKNLKSYPPRDFWAEATKAAETTKACGDL